MKLLAIESAFEACSVALWQDGTCLERVHGQARGHAQVLLPFVEELLAAGETSLAALDGIAFSRGPGSFTSLRIGIGVVQGLAFGAELPVWPVSSLRLVAQGALDEDINAAWVTMDARMGEVYTGCFLREGSRMVPAGSERVCAPAVAIPEQAHRWSPIGSGFERFEVLEAAADGRARPGWPRAAVLAELAAGEWSASDALTAAQAQPVYLRDHVADKPKSA